MSEYGQIVGNGSQIAGGGTHQVAAGGPSSGDAMAQLTGLVDSASTAAAGLPPAVLAALVLLGAIILLVFLRRVFG